MAGTLTLYTNPMSRGRIARWMLEEVGAPYETVIVGYGPEMKGADYLAINPMGKVPAIVHDSRVVTECAAICAYMADAFPEAGLAPAPADRAAYYRWLFFAAGPVEQAVTSRAMGWQVPEGKDGMIGFGSFEHTVEVLAGAVADGWIAGEAFSAADVYVGAHVAWGLQFGTLEARAEFTAYRDRIAAREAYKRATALDDAAMPEQQPG